MKLSYSLFLALCGMLAVSCSGADVDEPTVDGPVSSRASFSIQSRAVGDTSANELIQSWWIAFVGQDGKVSKIVSRDASKTDAVERDEFSVELPAGTYTAYAFANITRAELENATGGVTFTVGQPVAAELMKKEWSLMPNQWDKTKPIPMSGFKEVTFSSGQSASDIKIEVVRMVGKVEFTFSNRSTKDITINSLTFGHLAKGPVYLFPTYESLGKAPILLPNGLTTEDVEFTPGATPEARVIKAGATDALTDFFYVRESDAANPASSGHFSIKLNITRGGQTEEQLYALTDQLTYINRNDYIHIPIAFTDYLFNVDVLFYPPIGGYPAVITEVKDEEFYITFGTQGKFSLRPLIREAVDGSDYLTPNRFTTVTATVVSDQSNILTSTNLTYDTVTGESLGELTTATGRAEIKLHVEFNDGVVMRQYDKTIYIIRANK